MRLPNVLVFVLTVTLGHTSWAATGAPIILSRVEITLNGASLGPLRSVAGGDARTDVVVEKPQGLAPLKKHAAGITYAPFEVELSAPLSPSLLSWMSEFLANSQSSETLVVTTYTATGAVAGVPREAINTRIVEIRFPALDASSRDGYHLTLLFQPESVRDLMGTPPALPSPSGPARKASVTGNFQLQVPGLDATHVSRVEAFTITQRAINDSVAASYRDYSRPTPSLTLPNFVFSVGQQFSADWIAWRDDFVTKGNNGDAQEKSGTLSLLAPDLTPLLTLQLSHLGIVRASLSISLATDATPKVEAELYCESISISTTPAASANQPLATADKKSTETARASEETSSGSSTKSTTPPATKASTVATGPSLMNAPLATATAATVATPTAAGPGAPTAAGTATMASSTDDKGARDPADFPRPSATTRKSYSSMRQKSGTQEQAVYTVVGAVDSFESYYNKELPTLGWESVSRVENNFGVSSAHQIITTWKAGTRSATVTLTQTKTEAGEISIALSGPTAL